MTPFEFLRQFSIIRDHLFLIAPAFDKKQGFLDLLKYLQSNNLITNNLLIDLFEILQARNKIISSLSDEVALTPEIINKIQNIKENLNI